MRAVGVDHARRGGIEPRRRAIDSLVQLQRLARTVAGELVALCVDQRQSRGVEKAEARVRRRDEVPRRQADADVAGRSMHIPAVEQALSDPADFVAGVRFVHASTENALVKKSSLPKLPDFSAR